jgi:hypothetical protein
METINYWEEIKNVKIPDDVKNSVYEFMEEKIKKGIKKRTLTKTFMQIAVSSLIFIKMKDN